MSARRKEDTLCRLGPEGRNGIDRPKQNDTSEKSVRRMLKHILNSVSAIENKLEIVEAKLERLSTNKANRLCELCSDSLGRGREDSSFVVVTGSHISPLPYRKAKSPGSDEVVSSDSSSSDDDNDDSSEEQTNSCPVHDPKDFKQDIAVHHSLKVPREPIRKSLKTEQENVNTKHSGAKSFIESTTKVLPDNLAEEGKGMENVNSPCDIDNAKQTVDMQGKHNNVNVKTNKPPLRNVDMPTDELASLGEVDDKEKDLSSSFKRAIAASGSDNREEVESSTFSGQDVENELTDKQEEHMLLTSSQLRRSNNQQMSMSGFKNEHGNTDNRFLKEAHENIPQTSIRSGDLSNTRWIKSGAWKTDVVNLKHQLRELLEQQTRASRDSLCMRSAGIDTVICLDTSASMAGSPLGKAKTVISQLIDGFEQNAIEHDIEENVAVVVFGQQNKILNHLTNDYNVVRDELFQVTSGGPSPLWLGLALSLTEIKEKGNMVTVGESIILPRIILITDGYASPKYILSGDDTQNVDTIEETKQDIVTLLETCRKFSRTIDCIQVGQSAQDIVHLLSGERVFGPDDVEYLTQFFRVQDKADELTKKIMSGEIQTDGVDEVIKKSSFTKKAQDDLKELIKDVKFVRSEEEQHTEEMNEEKTVSSSNDNSDQSVRQGQARGGDSDMVPTPTRNDVLVQQAAELSETNEEHETDVIDDVKEPLFGTSVAPSETWLGSAARQDLTGTVMGPRKKGMVKILWSDGTTDRCRYGVNGVYDFKIVPDICFGSDVMHVGAIVERGPDWKWKDQDGGLGSIGVVTKPGDRVVFVTWSHGGQGNYRYGYNKKYDVKLCESRPRQQEIHGVWQIQDEVGNWHDFEQAATESIEQMYNYNPDSQFVVQLKSLSLRISIGKLEATDSKTRQTYTIRRLEQSNEHSSARDSL